MCKKVYHFENSDTRNAHEKVLNSIFCSIFSYMHIVKSYSLHAIHEVN